MSICGQAEQKSWPLDSLEIDPKNPAKAHVLTVSNKVDIICTEVGTKSPEHTLVSPSPNLLKMI